MAARLNATAPCFIFVLQADSDFIGTGDDPGVEKRFLTIGERPYPLVVLKLRFPVNGIVKFGEILAEACSV